MDIHSYLTGLFADYRRQGRERLPPIAALARMGGYSATTVSNALAHYVRESQCSVTPKKGIVLLPAGEHGAHAVPTARTAGRAEQVASAIARDIALKWSSPGAILPPAKLLCQQYGACHATVQSALALLTSRGIIVRDKKRYRVFGDRAPRTYATVAMVIPATGERFYSSGHGLDFWRGLEHACLARNVRLFFVNIDDLDTSRHLSRGGASSATPTLGYVIRPLDTQGDMLERALRHCGRGDTRVSMLLDSPLTPVPRWLLRDRRFAAFSIGFGDMHGVAVAKHLATLGHRSVAYFLPHGTDDIAGMNRYRGLRQLLLSLDPHANIRLFAQSAAAFESHMRSPEVRQATHDLVGGIDKLIAERMMLQTNIALTPHWLAEYAGDRHNTTVLYSCMEQLFTEAIADHSLTAWVGYNDTVAIEALRFLRAHHVRVPECMSVVGFDNRLESLGCGLTSYSFNVHALATAMLDHLLNHSNPFVGHTGEVIELPGHLLARETTGECRTMRSI